MCFCTTAGRARPTDAEEDGGVCRHGRRERAQSRTRDGMNLTFDNGVRVRTLSLWDKKAVILKWVIGLEIERPHVKLTGSSGHGPTRR